MFTQIIKWTKYVGIVGFKISTVIVPLVCPEIIHTAKKHIILNSVEDLMNRG